MTRACPGCSTEYPKTLLACPSCLRLTHTEELKSLAARAKAAQDPLEASALWREALALLPPGSSQHTTITREIVRLGQTPKAPSPVPKRLAALGALGVFLWKFKFLIVAVLSKGKLLIMGLTKFGTLASMFTFLAVLWSELGWPLALGLVISIYIHEMGHVAALRQAGLPAEAPMFVPGLGALVRLKHRPINEREDADIGLAGPMWGLAAALICWLVSLLSADPLWPALTSLGAMLNLFNLIPVWQLDGARGLRPLSRPQRWVLLAVLAAIYLVTRQGLLLLIGLGILLRSFGPGHEKGDTAILGRFAFLLVALSALAQVSIRV